MISTLNLVKLHLQVRPAFGKVLPSEFFASPFQFSHPSSSPDFTFFWFYLFSVTNRAEFEIRLTRKKYCNDEVQTFTHIVYGLQAQFEEFTAGSSMF